MLDIKAILATLAGVVVVGGVGTYVFLENSDTNDQATLVSTNPAISALETSKVDTSTLPSESNEAVKDSYLSDNTEVKDAGVSEDAPKDTAVLSEEPTKNWTMPAFDVLRVEPDGSTVIAGRGQPNTTLKVMNGDEVLNEVKIGSTGDFAVIFDQPLGSGDYQLTLKVEDEDGNALVSEETAIVSVPEDGSGQLLAMVTKPGKASRILAQPEAQIQAADKGAEKATKKVEIAANTTATENNVEVETEAPVATVSEPESAAAAAQKLAKEQETKASEISELKDNEGDAMKKTDENDTSTMTKDTASKEVEMVKEEATEAAKSATTKLVETAEADAKVEAMDKTVEAGSQESMKKATEKATAEIQPKSDAIVRIEAVEVEGDKLFVAGVASKGNTVRILVDGKEVGAVDVNSDGRFLIEAEQELSVGSHMITAVLEDKTTKEIVLQAVVPFDRPEAESAAAIAATTDTKAEKPEIAVASKEESTTSVDDKTTVETEVASNDTEVMTNEKASQTDNMKAKADAAVAKPNAAESDAANPEAVEPDTTMTKNEPQTIVQDTLTPAASQSVIIRKGDTLWQIARRTYGAGVRYTTIYLANQEQIQNPDLIEPGQIFMVPDEALENAEELHLKRLQGN